MVVSSNLRCLGSSHRRTRQGSARSVHESGRESMDLEGARRHLCRMHDREPALETFHPTETLRRYEPTGIRAVGIGSPDSSTASTCIVCHLRFGRNAPPHLPNQCSRRVTSSCTSKFKMLS